MLRLGLPRLLATQPPWWQRLSVMRRPSSPLASAMPPVAQLGPWSGLVSPVARRRRGAAMLRLPQQHQAPVVVSSAFRNSA